METVFALKKKAMSTGRCLFWKTSVTCKTSGWKLSLIFACRGRSFREWKQGMHTIPFVGDSAAGSAMDQNMTSNSNADQSWILPTFNVGRVHLRCTQALALQRYITRLALELMFHAVNFLNSRSVLFFISRWKLWPASTVFTSSPLLNISTTEKRHLPACKWDKKWTEVFLSSGKTEISWLSSKGRLLQHFSWFCSVHLLGELLSIALDRCMVQGGSWPQDCKSPPSEAGKGDLFRKGVNLQHVSWCEMTYTLWSTTVCSPRFLARGRWKHVGPSTQRERIQRINRAPPMAPGVLIHISQGSWMRGSIFLKCHTEILRTCLCPRLMVKDACWSRELECQCLWDLGSPRLRSQLIGNSSKRLQLCATRVCGSIFSKSIATILEKWLLLLVFECFQVLGRMYSSWVFCFNFQTKSRVWRLRWESRLIPSCFHWERQHWGKHHSGQYTRRSVFQFSSCHDHLSSLRVIAPKQRSPEKRKKKRLKEPLSLALQDWSFLRDFRDCCSLHKGACICWGGLHVWNTIYRSYLSSINQFGLLPSVAALSFQALLCLLLRSVWLPGKSCMFHVSCLWSICANVFGIENLCNSWKIVSKHAVEKWKI